MEFPFCWRKTRGFHEDKCVCDGAMGHVITLLLGDGRWASRPYYGRRYEQVFQRRWLFFRECIVNVPPSHL